MTDMEIEEVVIKPGETVTVKSIAVFAGSHAQYVNFLREHGLSPMQWVHITYPEQLMGRRGMKYVKVGTWMDSPVMRDGRVADLLKVYEMEEIAV